MIFGFYPRMEKWTSKHKIWISCIGFVERCLSYLNLIDICNLQINIQCIIKFCSPLFQMRSWLDQIGSKNVNFEWLDQVSTPEWNLPPFLIFSNKNKKISKNEKPIQLKLIELNRIFVIRSNFTTQEKILDPLMVLSCHQNNSTTKQNWFSTPEPVISYCNLKISLKMAVIWSCLSLIIIVMIKRKQDYMGNSKIKVNVSGLTAFIWWTIYDPKKVWFVP